MHDGPFPRTSLAADSDSLPGVSDLADDLARRTIDLLSRATDDGPACRELVAADSDPLPGASNFAEDPRALAQPLAIPMYRVFGGPLVPNLAKLPRERWREALVPQERSVRDLAALNLALGRDGMRAARDLVDALPPSPSELAREAIAAGPPHPSARRVEPQSRQLNVRVTARAYEDLCAAARLLGGTPTQIARMLVNGGVRRVLAEHDRAIDAARRAGER